MVAPFPSVSARKRALLSSMGLSSEKVHSYEMSVLTRKLLLSLCCSENNSRMKEKSVPIQKRRSHFWKDSLVRILAACIEPILKDSISSSISVIHSTPGRGFFAASTPPVQHSSPHPIPVFPAACDWTCSLLEYLLLFPTAQS